MKYEFLVGGYTRVNSKGIYHLEIDPLTKNSNRILLDEIARPTYLYYTQKQLFSTCVVEDTAGVMVYTYDHKKLARQQFLNIDEKNAPAHITLSKDLKYIVTSNYHEGCLSIYEKTLEGYRALDKIVESREGSHLHQAIFIKDDQWLLATDLGIDRVSVYDVENNFEKLFELVLPDGFGARHCLVNDQYLYCIGEYHHQVAVFELFEDYAELLQLIDIVDEKLEGSSSAAIRLSADKNFLYTSIRGQDQLSVFKVKADYLLEKIQELPAAGVHPRDFILTSDNKYLLAANKDSDSITVFDRNFETGKLEYLMEAFCEEGVTIVEIVEDN